MSFAEVVRTTGLLPTKQKEGWAVWVVEAGGTGKEEAAMDPEAVSSSGRTRSATRTRSTTTAAAEASHPALTT